MRLHFISAPIFVYDMLRLIAFCVLLAGSYATPIERVVNGTNATIGEIPYIVSLRFNSVHNCGGSILDANHILTAAHCVAGRTHIPKSYSIQYGVTHISAVGENVIRAKRIVHHPDFSEGWNYPNDIAIVTLEDDIPFSENVQPVVLPKQGDPTPANEEAILSGWGRLYTGSPAVKDLQRVDIICYSDEDCFKAHIGMTNKVHNICAGVPEGGKGQCSGDSGGPLYVNGMQVGIVSWSVKPCTLKGFPGVFAKVSSYIDWINNEMQMD